MNQKEQDKYVELRFKVPLSLKKELGILGQVKGMSANQVGTLLVRQILEREPNLTTALQSEIRVLHLENKLMPFYYPLLDSYSLLISTEISQEYEAFLQRGRSFLINANLFIQAINNDRQSCL